MQRVASPLWAPRRFSSCRSVTKGGAELAQALNGGTVAGKFVGIKEERLALLLGDLNGNDLLLELTGLLGGLGLLLGGRSKGVLLLARDPIFLDDVFGGDPHMHIIEDIPQPIVDHAVDKLPLAHLLAIARARQYMGSKAHVLLPTGHDQFRITGPDRLHRQSDRLEPAATDLIDRHTRDFFGD